MKYPDPTDKKRLLEDVKAETRRWGAGDWSDNQLNVYYHDVKKEFEDHQIKPISEMAAAV